MAKNKVLIVNSNLKNIEHIEKTFNFNKYGFEVCFSTTKENEAVDFILKGDVDVVFAAMQMPGMTGLELIKFLKDRGKTPCFCVFAEYYDFDYLLEAIQNKVVDYCLESIAESDAEEVLKRLRNHFDEDKLNGRVNSSVRAIDNKHFLKLIDYINEHYSEKIMLKDLAIKFFFNPNYLCMLFNKYVGKTYSQYLTCLRLEKARELLNDNRISTHDVAERVGFNNYSYFKKKYFQYWGETPKDSKEKSMAKNK